MRSCSAPVLALALGLAAGCGGGSSDAAGDGGVTDATVADAGGGARDAGDVERDAGAGSDGGATLDAGGTDGGVTDAGGSDGGGLDGGGSVTCSSCHGDPDSPAPPLDTTGGSATTLRGVGAHRSHLRFASWHRPVQCDDCHVVPAEIDAPGHDDTPLPAELTWSAVAAADGASPSLDAETCVGSYCHGATLLPGGTLTEPVWTRVDGTQAYCGSCHGLPPGGSHPTPFQCQLCHPTMSAPTIFADPTRHIDGVVDVDVSCTSCHGDATSPAPPSDTSGGTSTDLRSVGAHRSHLGSSGWHREVVCQDCHQVPSSVGSAGHVDTALPAELTWSSLATADGASPAMTGDTCGSVYCHGATLLPGGSITEPVWTTVDGSQAACGTCHGLPPGGGHPASSSCQLCHPTMSSPSTFAEPSRHIDGIVDVIDLGCSSCHGDSTSPAPPSDTTGGTSTDLRSVGAHRSHLGSSGWHREVVCQDCHLVPSEVGSAGHVDTALPAELTWSSLATADGASPSMTGDACGSVYCHGATLLPGGSITEPVWTTVDGSQAACGTCHGLPPGGSHVGLTACERCHGAVIDASGGFVAPELHVDGIVQAAPLHPPGWSAPGAHGATFNAEGRAACQGCHGANLFGGLSGVSCESCHPGWRRDCTFCHGGTFDTTGAPPEGVDGETARTTIEVGAHTEHVSDTSMHLAWDCDTCHVTPFSAMTPGHIDGDGVAEVTFGWLNPDATYDAATGVCASLYCHGNGSSILGSGDWDTDPTLDCGSCHADFFAPSRDDLRAMSGEHDEHVDGEGFGCDTCHSAVVDASGALLRIDLHVDGNVDVAVPSYDPTGDGGRGTCDPACHGSETWR